MGKEAKGGVRATLAGGAAELLGFEGAKKQFRKPTKRLLPIGPRWRERLGLQG